MSEKTMDNRGSKSTADFSTSTKHKSAVVKEQRVDGSWQVGYASCLRYTLIGFERNRLVNVLSKNKIQSYKRYYTMGMTKLSSSLPTSIKTCVINPWFVTGFTDAEGCFMIQVRKRKNNWYSEARFVIALHKKDLPLLNLIQAYFGGKGSILKHGKDSYQYIIGSIEDITTKVLPHFDMYPLISKKYSDYLLFKEAVKTIHSENHLTPERKMTRKLLMEKIVAIKASLNRGLSSELKISFPNTVPVPRPIVKNNSIPHQEWVAGFTSGEGCFIIKTSVSRDTTLGYGVQLRFQITQDGRDELLMKNLVDYFGCGRVVKNVEHNGNIVYFYVTKYSDIWDKIIPFFRQYNIIGEKLKDFEDWSRAGEIIKTKSHLTKEGLGQILKLKAGSNKGRSSS